MVTVVSVGTVVRIAVIVVCTIAECPDLLVPVKTVVLTGRLIVFLVTEVVFTPKASSESRVSVVIGAVQGL